MKKIIIIFLFAFLNAGYITQELLEKMKNTPDEEFISAVIFLKEHPDLSKLGNGRYKEKLELLKETAERSQSDIIAFLSSRNDVRRWKSFWINNSICVEARKDVIRTIALRPEVEYVDIEKTYYLADDKIIYSATKSSRSPTWNIERIKADSAWIYGYTGSNILIGILDSGFDPNHPALQGKWSGWWYDAVNHQNYPYDDHLTGHGTRMSGLIFGGDAQGPYEYDIGVAPGAKIVGAKGYNMLGQGQYEDLQACFEWFVSIKADSGVDVKVINNSWSSPYQGDLSFWWTILTLRDFDIVTVFSASGGSSGVRSPADYPTVIGVGATDINDNVTSWSGIGPAPNFAPYTDPYYWPREDWNRIKPNILAPGDSVLSCMPGDTFVYSSGTSQACAQVTGALAVLLEKNPYLNTDFEWIYSMLLDYADRPPQGEPYPNNLYGWGRVNVWNSILNSPSSSEPYLKIIYHFVNDPPPGGNNNSWPEPGEAVSLKVVLKNLGADAINVVGFLEAVNSGITIIDNSSLYGNIQREGTSEGEGFRFRSDSLWPSGIPARFVLTAYAQGSYEFVDTFEVTIGFTHYSGPDEYGYYAIDNANDTLYYGNAPRFNWIEIKNIGTPVYLSDDDYEQISLPFTFRFYGQDYNQVFISSNGFISFAEGSADPANTPIPDTTGPSAMIAGLWDDLNPLNPQRPVWFYHDTAQHIFVIEYDSIAHYGSPDQPEKFEIILYDPVYYPTSTGDGEIIIQYLLQPLQFDFTTGIEDPTEMLGIQYFYNDTLDPYGAWIEAGRAIKFTTYLEGLGINESYALNNIERKVRINSPSIFRKNTDLRLMVPFSMNIKIIVYDAMGRKIYTLLDGKVKSGNHVLRLPSEFSSGIYFIKVNSDLNSFKKKIIYLR